MFDILTIALWITAASMLLRRFKPPGALGLGGGDRPPTQTTTTTTKTEPPAFVIPFSKELLSRAQEQSTIFPQTTLPTGAERVVPFTQQEQLAFGLTGERAFAPSPFTDARVLAALGIGGVPTNFLEAGAQPISGTVPSLALLGTAGAPEGAIQLAGAGAGGVPTDLLRTGARGIPTEGLGRFAVGNIGFDPITNALVSRSQGDIIDQFNQQIAPSTAARFQRGGILGGTAQQEIEATQRFGLARALGDIETGIRGQAVNRALTAEQTLAALLEGQRGRQLVAGRDIAGFGEAQRQRQLAAAGLLGGFGESQLQRMLQASGLLGGLGEAERQRQLTAGTGIADIFGAQRQRELAAAGLLGGFGQTEEQIFAQRLANLEAAGAQQRGLSQFISDIDFQNLLEQRNIPLTQLDILGAAINTAGGGFANQTGTQTTVGSLQPRPNPFIGALGGAGSFLGGLGLFGEAAGLFGGAAAAPFIMSSKKLKYDDGPAERILDRVKQLPIRTWKYKGQSELHIGPYAEDFLEIFGLGNGITLPLIDVLGVLFQSVKDLSAQMDMLEARVG